MVAGGADAAGADAAVRARGGERIVQVITRFLDAVITNAGMRRWRADEGELAMRLLTRHDTGFQPRLIGAVHGLLQEEANGGALDVILGEQPNAAGRTDRTHAARPFSPSLTRSLGVRRAQHGFTLRPEPGTPSYGLGELPTELVNG